MGVIAPVGVILREQCPNYMSFRKARFRENFEEFGHIPWIATNCYVANILRYGLL